MGGSVQSVEYVNECMCIMSITREWVESESVIWRFCAMTATRKSTNLIVTKDYANPQKLSQWSCRVANLLTEHSKLRQKKKGGPHRSKQTVFYLAEQNIDGYLLEKRGFKRCNLIPCNKNKRVVERLRSDGWNAHCGDFSLAIALWPESWPLDYIIADFTCGFELSGLQFMASLVRSKAVHKGTLITLNLMRGRDAFSNPYRESLRQQGCEDLRLLKNRAQQWLNFYMQECIEYQLRMSCKKMNTPYLDGMIQCVFDEMNTPESTILRREWSYRNDKGLWFDTVIFSPIIVDEWVKSTKIDCSGRWHNLKEKDIRNTAKMLSARKAVHTAQLNASLPK